MATETADGLTGHVRSVTVTTLASLMGIVAALISEYGLGADPSGRVNVFVVLGAIAVQVPILQALGVDTQEFSTKDYLYVAFMTFSLWFVSWTLILTASAV
ncbi:EMC6-like membrane protein [Halapricum desulfuricans]|uniref:Putative membrane protein n=1 Tax=Halapricum desulfuricans TaxID=2841257 RepID=A0A897N8P2_9EURY|nr:hypothetical protein [Halapricum desulfuricans]QSG09057.1 putative membrane protein [Halapricum desulfuricans]QSG12210.1 putative membrane protein [Halapricum desulfuricans]